MVGRLVSSRPARKSLKRDGWLSASRLKRNCGSSGLPSWRLLGGGLVDEQGRVDGGVVRRDDLLEDPRRVAEDGPQPHPVEVAGGGAAAARRAELADGLVHLQVVVAAEQREHVVGVLGVAGRLGLGRVVAGEHRRHGPGGVAGHAGGVAVPGRLVGQLGEVRVDAPVDLALGVEQGAERELVEQDHHQRRLPAGGRGHRRLAARVLGLHRQHQRGGRRHQQEDKGEDQRRGRQVAQPELQPRLPDVHHDRQQAAGQGDGDQQRPALVGQASWPPRWPAG